MQEGQVINAIVMLQMALLSGFPIAVICAFKFHADARFWQQDSRDLRECYRFEKQRREWLQKQLEDERKEKRDGVYR
jgi:type III secretory pathway component EscV